MIAFLFKILITGLLLILWWYLKRYLKNKFTGSSKSNLWSHRLRFDNEILGRGKLKIRQDKSKGLTISFEAEDLDKGRYNSVSVLIGGNDVLKIHSHEVLNGQRKVKKTLISELINADELSVLVDGIKIASSKITSITK